MIYRDHNTQLLVFDAIGLNPFILILDDHRKHFTELTDMNHIGQEFMTDLKDPTDANSENSHV